MLFLRARYYQPGTGRFVTPDKISPNFANPATFNFFLYVDNNPVNYLDASGHDLACPNPGDCPLPPPGKVWKHLGAWTITVYGHADHELWPKPSDTTKTEIHWLENNGEVQTAEVNKDWLDNVRAQGTAGRLMLSNEKGYREVWLKCDKTGKESVLNNQKLECSIAPYPQSLAKGVGVRVACNPCPDLSTGDEWKHRTTHWCRDDVKQGDTLCLARWPNVVKLRGTGFGRWPGEESLTQRTEWLDMYIGLHGPDYKGVSSPRDIWVLGWAALSEMCFEGLPCPM